MLTKRSGRKIIILHRPRTMKAHQRTKGENKETFSIYKAQHTTAHRHTSHVNFPVQREAYPFKSKCDWSRGLSPSITIHLIDTTNTARKKGEDKTNNLNTY